MSVSQMPPSENNNGAKSTLDFFLKNLWGKRAGGLNLPVEEIFSSVTPENIAYLLNFLFPFIQIVSTSAAFAGEAGLRFITAKSGWIIHDYGEAMSTSLGNFLYKGSDYYALTLPQKESEASEGGEAGGSGTSELKPNGTLVKQAYDTAFEMVELVHQKGWPGIQIVAGTPTMEWAVWVAAEEKKMKVVGFTPDKKAQDKRQRISTPEILASFRQTLQV